MDQPSLHVTFSMPYIKLLNHSMFSFLKFKGIRLEKTNLKNKEENNLFPKTGNSRFIYFSLHAVCECAD